MKKYFCNILMVLILCISFVSNVNAKTTIRDTILPRGIMIDQRSDKTTGNQFASAVSIGYFSPIGQEFVPSKNKLVGVDIFVNYVYTDETTLIVNIREGDISGKILAKSTAFVAKRYNGWVHFRFIPPVKLKIGSKYVIQVELSDPTRDWGLVSNGNCFIDTYPKGARILQGIPSTICKNDFAFRTYSLKNR